MSHKVSFGVTQKEYPASSLFYQAYRYRYWVSMKQIHSAKCAIVGSELLGDNRHVVIIESGLCTYEDKRFYSYRREGDLAGRLNSYIFL